MGGDTIGPYRVAERLGAGGMGEVFQAFDESLDRWVAIKRIRPDKEEDPDNRERFRREARAAARLNHPAIVHVYQIFSDGESDCIVMEYVEGRRLDEILLDGPLDPRRAAALGREIAEGLAEAHEQGILHRDLKTENVVVTPRGHAKILDFGLAKPIGRDELDGSLTAKGQVVGTSRAMPPEYVSGDPVDHRSDLFQLGVLLYEATTGQSPFQAHNALATLKRVIIHQPTPAREVNGAVPPELSELIERLLEKEPEDRPQSAAEVAAELGRIAGIDSSLSGEWPPSTVASAATGIARPALETTAPAGRPRRRRLGVALALVLLGGLGVVSYRWIAASRAPRFSFQARDLIVLGNFENLTGEPILDETLEVAFRLGLEQSRYAEVLPQRRVREALERMQRDPGTRVDRELGIELCLREAARALVVGSIVKIGSAYALSGEVIDPESGASVFTDTARAEHQDEILARLDGITQAIRTHLGESLAAIEESTRPLERVTTGNLEALRAYSRAIEKLDEGETEAAIPLLARALEIDPEFAMAHAKLGTLYRNLDLDQDKATEHLRRALADSDRLTEVEKLYLEGWKATWSGTPDEMVQAWSLMRSLHPEQVAAHYNLGMVYWLYGNRFAEAAEAFAEAAAVASGQRQALAYRYLGYCQLAQDQNDAALGSFRQAGTLDRSAVDLFLPEAYTALRRYDEADGIITRGLEAVSTEVQLEARLRQILSLADRGRLATALEVARRAERQASELDVVQAQLAARMWILVLLERLGPPAELRAELALAARRFDARFTDEKDEEYGLSVLPTLALVGKIAARNGATDDAARILERIRRPADESGFAIWRAYAALLEGELLAAAGRYDRSLALLHAAETQADPFQAHEGLARVLAVSGDADAARAEYRWIAAHRGRAFAECVGVCFSRPLDVLDATLALFHLATLPGAGSAAPELSRFLEQWQEGDRGLPEIAAARRLAGLDDAPSGDAR